MKFNKEAVQRKINKLVRKHGINRVECEFWDVKTWRIARRLQRLDKRLANAK